MTSVTRRTLGRGGKTYSFWAWYSFKMSFWSVPPSAARGHTGVVGDLDVHGEHRRGRRVDGHGRRHGPEVDAAEERLHVGQRVDRNPGPADLPLGPGVVRVAAEQRRHVEGGGQPVAAGAEQLLEAAVGVRGAAEAGELAHRPQARAVHGGVRAPGVGVLAGHLGTRRPVDGRERHPRHRLEPRGAPRRPVELLLPGVAVGHGAIVGGARGRPRFSRRAPPGRCAGPAWTWCWPPTARRRSGPKPAGRSRSPEPRHTRAS